jgi:acetate---CoA ligase (ADP-forming)
MSVNPLNIIMSPKSIAVIGASNNPFNMGSMQYLTLLHSGYPGDVFPVHPKEETVFGNKAYSSISDLPYAPDIVLMVVPTKLIPEMMKDLGKLGTRHAVVISAGFKEAGEDGVKLEKQVISIADEFNIRFLGPNCMGLLNAQYPLNLTTAPLQTPPGNLGIISQSGTYISQTLPYLGKSGIRLSKAMSVGNEANIDIVDCLEYLEEDDDTKAIGMYIECIRRADKFLEVVSRITRKKPVVVQYVGGTDAGGRSGTSHTGAIAGPDNIYNGLFEQSGVIRVNSIEEVYKTGHVFATQPVIKGKNIAILTNSGGPGTAIATTLDGNGLNVPELSDSVQEKIKKSIPGHASSKNPVDLTFHTDIDLMVNTLPEILMKSDETDGLIVHGIMGTGYAKAFFPAIKRVFDISMEDIEKGHMFNLDKIVKMPSLYGKPLMISTFFGNNDNACSFFQDNLIPTFDSPEKAAHAMSSLYEYFLIRNRPNDNSSIILPIPKSAANIIRSGNGVNIDEFNAKEVLRSYGIPTCREKLVTNYKDAINAAMDIGYPVAVKACSSEIQHKTENNLVHLNLDNEDEVKTACESIQNIISGVPMLVCEMIKGDRELMSGMTRFPGFPPCIMFGMGGVFTEILDDNKIRFAPFGKNEALSMIETIKSHEIIENYRGMDPVDKEALSNILIKLGNIAVQFPEIKEIDLNPIIIQDGKPFVVDALFVI